MLNGWTCAAMMFIAAASFLNAQGPHWEVGGMAGAGFSPDMTVKNATVSASASVRPGVTVGAYAAQNMYRYWSGEVNYLYRAGDLRLAGNGQTATFGAHTHMITGDFLVHFLPRDAHVRPFVSFGGGIEIMEGTGQEAFNQPLGNLAALTATQEVLPVGEVGLGVKFQLSNHMLLRVQGRDYISQAPHEVIAPAPGAKLSGPRHDAIGMLAIAYTW